MPPKKANPGGSAPKKTETATVKGIRELLKDYELRADRYETTVANSIRKICKKAMDDDRQVHRNGLLSRGCYPVQRIELIDCLIDPKSIGILTSGACLCRTLRELCLDFNDELILDGNALEAEGAIALLSQLSEAAESEGFERAEEIRRQQMAVEEAKQAAKRQIDLDNADPNEAEQDQGSPNTSPPPAPPGKPQSAQSSERAKSGKKKKKKGRRGKKGSKMELPPSGPQISVLKLADTGINHMGRGGNFAPVRCMQLLKSIITHSKDLQEIDLFANEIGDLGARQLLEGILARKEFKLPQIGIRLGYRINQDTFDIIHKLAPGPKRKGKKKGAKAGR